MSAAPVPAALKPEIASAEQIVQSMLIQHGLASPPPRPVGDVNAADKPLSKFFDHTHLKPEGSAADIADLCAEAIAHNCAAVCVPPNRVAQATAALTASDVAVCTVIGFPHGYATSRTKVAAVAELKQIGCTEFDMVQPIGLLQDGDYYALYRDIRAVVEAVRPHLTKIILETAFLTTAQKLISSLVAIAAGVDYLKTSTGFATAGATIADITLLRAVAGDYIGVKASGGVRDYAFARACIAAGADRIGASRTVEILATAAGDVRD